MPTRPLTVSIAIDPRADARRRRERKAERLERRPHPVEPADDLPAERNQHERQRDDEEALEEIGPRRGDQSADEAVEDEHDRHRHDDLVHADAAARRLADDLAGAFEHAAGVDDEEAQRKDDVDRGHPRAVAIFGELGHGRPADAPEHRRHEPVERRDEEVLPLKPDRGRADAVDRAGERHRHLGVGADAEALADHQPRAELAPAEEVLAALADAVADDEADRRDDDEVGDEDRPVEGCNVHVRRSRSDLRQP